MKNLEILSHNSVFMNNSHMSQEILQKNEYIYAKKVKVVKQGII